MRRRKLGRTGWDVSEIGFGAWGLGGGLWRGVDPRDAQKALYAALDAGINFVDTALAYGDGTSERLVGEAIRDARARDWAVVVTKVPPRDRRWPSDPDAPLDEVFPPDHVTRSVEQSLRNLRAEALCVAQLHGWRDAWLEAPMWPTLCGTMRQLVKAGKVLHWGVSVAAHEPDAALALVDEYADVERDPLIGTAQVLYNIYDPGAARALLPLAAEREVGVIARVPFDEGALTGALTGETEFARGDWRRRYFAGPRLAEAVARADALRPLLGDEARTLPELALRFCLARPEVSCVIPGMRRVEHVLANAAVSDGRTLSAALRRRLAEHAWDKNWYRDDPV